MATLSNRDGQPPENTSRACVVNLWKSSFERCILQSFAHFSVGFVWFFITDLMRSLFWMEVLCQRTRFWILFLLRFAFSFLSNLPTFSFKVSVFWVFRNLDLHQSSKSIFLCYLLEALARSLSHLYLPSTWNWVLGKGGIGIRILFFPAVIFSWPLKNHAVLCTAYHRSRDCRSVSRLRSSAVCLTWADPQPWSFLYW